MLLGSPHGSESELCGLSCADFETAGFSASDTATAKVLTADDAPGESTAAAQQQLQQPPSTFEADLVVVLLRHAHFGPGYQIQYVFDLF